VPGLKPTPNENGVNATVEAGVSGPAADGLARVQRHALELLARLDRPPRTLRITVGEVTVDLGWADAPAAPVPTAPAPAAPAPTAPAAAAPAGSPCYLTSPAVGVFYHAAGPGADPFVSVGSTVRVGEQIGIVEAMKLMIPIEADRAGRITAVVKGNGEPVEYGEELFAIEDLEA
jgi:acetyl-CoA carboxylase biotin carboxyl carrier protein